MQFLILIALLFSTAAVAQDRIQGANEDLLQKLPDIVRNQCTRAMNADVSYEAQLVQSLEKAQAEIKRLTDKYEPKK